MICSDLLNGKTDTFSGCVSIQKMQYSSKLLHRTDLTHVYLGVDKTTIFFWNPHIDLIVRKVTVMLGFSKGIYE